MPILAQLTQYLHNLEYNTASFSNLQYILLYIVYTILLLACPISHLSVHIAKQMYR